MPARRATTDAGADQFLRGVGGRIRALRIARAWSQEYLGARADMHRNHIGGIERGELNVTARNLFRLARALEVSVQELLPDS